MHYRQKRSAVFKRAWRSYLAALMIFGWTLPAWAQQYYFHNYTGEAGLSQLVVQALFQDRDGYLWIGTQAGLNRFNGHNFEIFSIRQGLANDRIHAIAQDRQGRLWVGTNGGLATGTPWKIWNRTRADSTNETLQPFFENVEETRDKQVLSLAIDKEGNIWCGTRNGLYRWNGTRFQHFDESAGLPQSQVNAVLFDDNGRLWVGTETGLFYLADDYFLAFQNDKLNNQKIYCLVEDPNHVLWVGLEQGVRAFQGGRQIARYTSADGLAGLPVNAICAGRDGVLWVGTSRGLGMIRDNELRFITITNGLPFYYVDAILEDREGIIWIGGVGGVCKFQGRPFTNYTTVEGLGSNDIRMILRDQQGVLCAATRNGLSRFNGRTWHNFTTEDGLNDNGVQCLWNDRQGHLWIGSRKGVNIFDGEQFHDQPEISGVGPVVHIVADKRGVLWFAVSGVGLFVREENEYRQVDVPDQSFANIRLLIDRKGNLWASGRKGLSRWNGRNWRTFTTADGLASDAPYFLCQDQQGLIWFGYHSSHGVTRFDGTKFKTYTTEDGLFNDAVYSLGVDHNNNLWIGTARGVDRFDGEHFINYGPSEGYASSESNSRAFFADDDSTIWFGTAEGLSHYDPRDDLPVTEPPIIRIDRLILGNKTVPLDSAVSLTYSHNDLLAHISCLSFINRKRLTFRYRLLGYDEAWKPLHSYEINYTNLPPGDYMLEVQGRKYRRDWSRSATARFTIEPPYWRTWWFGLMITFVVGTMGASLYKYRVYKIQSRN